MDRPVLLLLPEPLETFAHRSLVEELLATGLAVAADPPRISYQRQAAFAPAVARKQAKRLRKRLKGAPRAVIIFSAAQVSLARALGGEVWFETTTEPQTPPPAAALTFAAHDRDVLEEALQRLMATNESGTDPAT